jgi:hypothetical protein
LVDDDATGDDVAATGGVGAARVTITSDGGGGGGSIEGLDPPLFSDEVDELCCAPATTVANTTDPVTPNARHRMGLSVPYGARIGQDCGNQRRARCP